ncbi:helix-turn-helix domain-containing protein [uncultured Sulfitobacter sp.]|uniref:winged helix-turn-helix transcriptional regulator n=1 Tax=uncultured Sulfitobacter sp. TaxID=191468 RepID=UPI0025979E85|nr:helix-turn-helix domain-containing protein [uncultured Sulfitobacter sp.]
MMKPERPTLFCPVKMACEILSPRWTIQILAELWWGSSRFNELRRGIPGISPTLLAKRLRELEANGLVERIEDPGTGNIEYIRTEAAVELEPVIQNLGEWAYRNSNVHDTMCHAEPRSFIWHLRHNIDTSVLPKRRVVFQFTFPEQADRNRDFWIVCKPGEPVDVCYINPGFDVDLFVQAELEVMVSVYFGYTSLSYELGQERIQLVGYAPLARSIGRWLILSSYARIGQEERKTG